MKAYDRMYTDAEAVSDTLFIKVLVCKSLLRCYNINEGQLSVKLSFSESDSFYVWREIIMGKILKVQKQTDNRFVNIYELDNVHKSGREGKYFFASRADSIDSLKMTTRKNKPDGVIIYALAGEKKDKIVLIRQYRYPIDDYIYEFPAGLVEADEDYVRAAEREIYEETGMKFNRIEAPEGYERPFFTTIGMTDEACATVFGYCEGEPTSENQEDSEEIEVVLADRDEVRRILKEEKIAIMTAYMLMHFICDKEPLNFLVP